MFEITRGAVVPVGADLAKRVIQVHAVDAAGRRVVGRALKREQFMAWCAQLPAGCLVAWRPARVRITGRANCARSAWTRG
jgi:transposase